MSNINSYKYMLLLLLIITSCKQGHKNNSAQNSTEPILSLKEQLRNSNTNKVMVIAHRGDWRNAPENSLQAIQNCIDMGVNMVEIDVRLTKDSIPVLMHDKTIDRTTNGKGKIKEWTLDSLKTLYLKNGANHTTHHRVPTLEEALLTAKGKILVNLDKCYDNFDKAYEVLQKTGTKDQVIMKGKVPLSQVKKEFGQYLDEVYFMPVVDIDDANAQAIVNDYINNFKPVAFEFVFSSLDSPLLPKFDSIKNHGSRVWVNSLWESLNGGYEDDMALTHTDSIYGWYVKKGINMIQTDRPKLLLSYLRKRGLHK